MYEISEKFAIFVSTLTHMGLYAAIFSHSQKITQTLPFIFAVSAILVGPAVRATGLLCIRNVRDKAAIYQPIRTLRNVSNTIQALSLSGNAQYPLCVVTRTDSDQNIILKSLEKSYFASVLNVHLQTLGSKSLVDDSCSVIFAVSVG